MVETEIKDFSQILRQITKTANSGLPLKKVLNSVCRSTARALEASGATIMALNPQKEHLIVVAAYGLSDLFIRKGAVNAHKSLPDVMEGKMAFITDIATDEGAQYPEAAALEKINAIVGVPLLNKDEIMGELRIYLEESRKFFGNEKDFIWSVSNIIAMAMESNKLRQLLENERHFEISSLSQKIPLVQKLPPPVIRPASFSHPSEEQFAKLLDFYKIEWLHEPRSFPLEWRGDKLAEMFTPDFYLPDLDIYIELTTMKQSLATEKNRKIRRLKELYPEINIKLLNKNDYQKMLLKYGYAPLDLEKIEGIDRVLFNDTQIQQRIRNLGNKISKDYQGKQLLLVGILKGMVCFMADLMRNITVPLSIDFMAVSYYGADQTVQVTKEPDASLTGVHVLMVEDIVDTGMTLNYVLNYLSKYYPASLKVCTLMDKKVRRLVNVQLDYIGFEIPDEFVVGYGLDYRSEYRNLPFIGTLKPKIREDK